MQMKNYSSLCELQGVFLTFFIVLFLVSEAKPQSMSDSAGEINLADPTIFFHDKIYYLYGTVDQNVNNGFTVYTSTDLENWEGPKGATDGYALHKTNVFGDKGFWAPQVFVYGDKFYMAYTANENIAIAESNSPLGPFKQAKKEALAAPVKQIDPFVFMDDDGKKYLYHVRLKDGNRIFVAEMEDDLSGIKEETLVECISAEEPWENTENVSWPVAEGPSVLKKDGLYYLIYSANDFRNIDYGVGYAVSSHPLGPWEKFDGNPIITRKDLKVNGTGHGDFLKDENGKLIYVFHTHQSDEAVAPRKTAIINLSFDDKAVLEMEYPSFYYPNLDSQK